MARRSQAERREQAESSLIEAAIELIAQKGFDGFTLAEVAQAAGYSRGLPVHYFGTKENLLGRVAQYLVDTYLVVQTRIPMAARGLCRLEQLIRHYASRPPTASTRALGILVAHASVHPQLHTVIAGLNARGLDLLEEEIRLGVAAGNIRPDVACTQAASMIYAFLRGMRGFAAMDADFDRTGVTEEFIASVSAYLRPPGRPQAATPPSETA